MERCSNGVLKKEKPCRPFRLQKFFFFRYIVFPFLILVPVIFSVLYYFLPRSRGIIKIRRLLVGQMTEPKYGKPCKRLQELQTFSNELMETIALFIPLLSAPVFSKGGGVE